MSIDNKLQGYIVKTQTFKQHNAAPDPTCHVKYTAAAGWSMAAENAFSPTVLLLVNCFMVRLITVMCHAEPGVQDSKNSMENEE